MNETLIGITVPDWMILISQFAVPAHIQTDVLLHGKLYNPETAVDNNIFNGFIDDKDDILESLKSITDELLPINNDAYKATKQSMRNEKIFIVIDKLKNQLSEMFKDES